MQPMSGIQWKYILIKLLWFYFRHKYLDRHRRRYSVVSPVPVLEVLFRCSIRRIFPLFPTVDNMCATLGVTFEESISVPC